MADYLATVHEPPFDGVVYHSAQHQGGKNVTLFARALKVGADDVRYPLPETAVTWKRIGADDDASYCLHLHHGTGTGEKAERPDLQVDTAAIEIRTVRKVNYVSSVSHPISYRLRRQSGS